MALSHVFALSTILILPVISVPAECRVRLLDDPYIF